MSGQQILYPVFAMALLAFTIAVIMRKCRSKAREEGLDTEYFKLNSGSTPPDYLIRVSQHYDNLFEMPVLFYTVSLMIFVTGMSDPIFVGLAWVYVAFRYLHAVVHTVYNNLTHRKLMFLFSSLTLMVIWVRLFIKMI